MVDGVFDVVGIFGSRIGGGGGSGGGFMFICVECVVGDKSWSVSVSICFWKVKECC